MFKFPQTSKKILKLQIRGQMRLLEHNQQRQGLTIK